MRIHVTGGDGLPRPRVWRLWRPAATTERVEIRDRRRRRRAARATAARRRHPHRVPAGRRGRARDRGRRRGATSRSRAASAGARLVHLSTDVVFDGRLGAPVSRGRRAVTRARTTAAAKAEAEAARAGSVAGRAVVRTSLIIGGPGHEPSKHEQVGARRGHDVLRQRAALAGPGHRPRPGTARTSPRRRSTGVLNVAGRGRRLPRRPGRARASARPCGEPPRPPTRPLDCRLDSSRARALLPVTLRGARTVFA